MGRLPGGVRPVVQVTKRADLATVMRELAVRMESQVEERVTPVRASLVTQRVPDPFVPSLSDAQTEVRD